MAANQVTTAAGRGWVYLELGWDQVSPQEGVTNCGNITVLYTAALWPHGHQGQQTSPAVKSSSGLSFLFSQLFFPTKQKGHRGNWDKYFTSSLWTLVGRSLSRLLQRFDDETVASLDQPVVEGWRVRGVPWWGFAGFQDCSGKDCLKLKRFFSPRSRCEGGRRSISGPFGARMIKQTIFQHVYLERDEDNIYVSHSLSWRLYFWMDLFFCKKGKTLCKGSCQLRVENGANMETFKQGN